MSPGLQQKDIVTLSVTSKAGRIGNPGTDSGTLPTNRVRATAIDEILHQKRGDPRNRTYRHGYRHTDQGL
jgi:hypothetical protein